MRMGHRARLYPSVEQAVLLIRWTGCARFIWNLARDQRRWFKDRKIGKVAQCLDLTELRSELPWLTEMPAQVAQQVLSDLDLAYQRYWAGLTQYPNPKRKEEAVCLRFPQTFAVRRLSKHWGVVKLPKLGEVRFRWTRSLAGAIKNVTVSHKAGEWSVSFSLESKRQPMATNHLPEVGVDLGVEVAYALSNGHLLDRKMWTSGEQRRLLHLEQTKVHQHKHSRRYHRTVLGIAKLHARAARRRHDFAHKVSTHLAKNHGLVAIEALRVPNMTRSAKGTVEKPGKNVAAKSGLNRAVLDKGWGLLNQNLRYKTQWYGSQLVEVPAAFTSLTCPNPNCAHISSNNRPFRSVFICEMCGHSDHADVSAAHIILQRGIALAAAEGHSVVGRKARKKLRTWRQPTLNRTPVSAGGISDLKAGEDVNTGLLCLVSPPSSRTVFVPTTTSSTYRPPLRGKPLLLISIPLPTPCASPST